jgi:hypothetical protein
VKPMSAPLVTRSPMVAMRPASGAVAGFVSENVKTVSLPEGMGDAPTVKVRVSATPVSVPSLDGPPVSRAAPAPLMSSAVTPPVRNVRPLSVNTEPEEMAKLGLMVRITRLLALGRLVLSAIAVFATHVRTAEIQGQRARQQRTS